MKVIHGNAQIAPARIVENLIGRPGYTVGRAAVKDVIFEFWIKFTGPQRVDPPIVFNSHSDLADALRVAADVARSQWRGYGQHCRFPIAVFGQPIGADAQAHTIHVGAFRARVPCIGPEVDGHTDLFP